MPFLPPVSLALAQSTSRTNFDSSNFQQAKSHIQSKTVPAHPGRRKHPLSHARTSRPPAFAFVSPRCSGETLAIDAPASLCSSIHAKPWAETFSNLAEYRFVAETS